jgi:hypothetical protein
MLLGMDSQKFKVTGCALVTKVGEQAANRGDEAAVAAVADTKDAATAAPAMTVRKVRVFITPT